MNHLFWLSTLIPGFAMLLAVCPGDLRRGLLATLAWSFGLTVALISPVVVIAHWLELTTPTVASLYLGLVALGLLKGSVASLIKREAYRSFYMHRVGHWLGLDVHDVGDYRHWLVDPSVFVRLHG